MGIYTILILKLLSSLLILQNELTFGIRIYIYTDLSEMERTVLVLNTIKVK